MSEISDIMEIQMTSSFVPNMPRVIDVFCSKNLAVGKCWEAKQNNGPGAMVTAAKRLPSLEIHAWQLKPQV